MSHAIFVINLLSNLFKSQTYKYNFSLKIKGENTTKFSLYSNRERLAQLLWFSHVIHMSKAITGEMMGSNLLTTVRVTACESKLWVLVHAQYLFMGKPPM